MKTYAIHVFFKGREKADTYLVYSGLPSSFRLFNVLRDQLRDSGNKHFWITDENEINILINMDNVDCFKVCDE